MNKVGNFGAAMAALLLTLAGAAQATPIKPDLKKLLSEPQAQTPYVPARAGWNGPEVASAPANAALSYLTQQPPAWEEIASVAVPDVRLVLLLGAAILLLRTLRQRDEQRKAQRQEGARVLPFPSAEQERKTA